MSPSPAGPTLDAPQPMRRIGATADLAVVICTHNRPRQLQRALRSLASQTRRPAEVIVVDNAPPDDKASRVVAEAFSQVRYVVEPVQGLDFARNRGLAESARDVIAFLDDDAVADVEWVGETEAVFRESPQIALCTGRVEALALDTEGQRLFEANGGFGRGEQRIHLPRDRRRRLGRVPAPLVAWSISVGSGCSLAVRREIVCRLGGFDEALDLGAALPGGGDLDMIWRVLQAGYEVVYEPRVRAWHEHRTEVHATIDQIVEHNRSLIAVLAKSVLAARGGRRVGVGAFLAWRLLKPFVRAARRVGGRDPLPLSALMRLGVASFRGLVTYPACRRLALRRRHGV